MTWREALVATALAVFVVGFVFAGIGGATVANASARNSLAPHLLTTGHWLEAVSGWILAACSGVAAGGFLVSAGSRAPAPTH